MAAGSVSAVPSSRTTLPDRKILPKVWSEAPGRGREGMLRLPRPGVLPVWAGAETVTARATNVQQTSRRFMDAPPTDISGLYAQREGAVDRNEILEAS